MWVKCRVFPTSGWSDLESKTTTTTCDDHIQIDSQYVMKGVDAKVSSEGEGSCGISISTKLRVILICRTIINLACDV